MSRSGYVESGDWGDFEYNLLNLYRANVDRALTGIRGQKFLKELAVAMDAMPEKKLITDELIDETGNCCTIGVICKARNLPVGEIDIYDPQEVAKKVGIATAMAAEIEYLNDKHSPNKETPEARWIRMRLWVSEQIREDNGI